MHQADIERACQALYREAGFNPSSPQPVGRLARVLLGTGIETASMIRGREGELCRVRGRFRIFVRRGLPAPHARFVAAHELAHWWVRTRRLSPSNEERACDALGAAIVVPSPAFCEAISYTTAIAPLANAFATMQTLILLRWGECEGTPVAVVEPKVARVRGRPYPWPEEKQLRAIAYAGPWKGKRVRITDAPMRIGLMAR